jgi:hypothetical protein
MDLRFIFLSFDGHFAHDMRIYLTLRSKPFVDIQLNTVATVTSSREVPCPPPPKVNLLNNFLKPDSRIAPRTMSRKPNEAMFIATPLAS